MVKRLAWNGLLAATGALAAFVAHRLAAAIWVRVTGEAPPDDRS
ncbi:hypothetical protein HRbin41_00108 [bacterium HR41]|nr:hypothetical protein HRbin41_00108 [bacterium HR41]